ncbi:MAG: uracil-DNA glycosylase [Clostridia bacterium]|nr:uracil-DNA glycosylase [Clostridia bacterium]
MYSAEFEKIKDECTLCKKCQFHEDRLNIVFGCGNERADILFVGDAPRGRDDLKGTPLSGRSGECFGKFLTLFDLDGDRDIFLTNILKCRPSDEEIPDNTHFDACMEHLRNQVRFMKPKIIVCLGETAAKKMIAPDLLLRRKHGKIIKKGKLFFLATYHPAEITDDEDKRVAFLSDFTVLHQWLKESGILST